MVGKAVARASILLGLTNATLGRVIGVSDATASRLRSETYTLEPSGKPYELGLLLVRLFRGLDAVMGGDEESMRSWMSAHNRALGGVPRDLVQTVTGLVAAVDYVDAVRAKI